MSDDWLSEPREVVIIKRDERRKAYDEYVSGFNLDDPLCRISTLNSKFYEYKKVEHHSRLDA